jgi:hypothetical protein
VQKSTRRKEGWITCQSEDAKSQHIKTEGGEQVTGLEWWWVCMFSRAQCVVVSRQVCGPAHINLKSVSGTTAAARIGLSG